VVFIAKFSGVYHWNFIDVTH